MARGVKGMWPRRRRAALADDLLDLAAHGLERDAERLERLGGDALALVDQPEQDVLGADVVVVEEARFFLGEDDDSAGPVGEAFEQVTSASHGRGSWPSVADLQSTARIGLVNDRRSATGGVFARVRRRRFGRSRRAYRARRGRPGPLLRLPVAWRDDLDRVESAAAASVAGRGPVPHRGGRPPDRGRRQARAARVRRRRRGLRRRARDARATHRRGHAAASPSSWCTSARSTTTT